VLRVESLGLGFRVDGLAFNVKVRVRVSRVEGLGIGIVFFLCCKDLFLYSLTSWYVKVCLLDLIIKEPKCRKYTWHHVRL